MWLQYAAAFTLVATSVIALVQDNLKARLAYSTISQLAYIVLAAAHRDAHRPSSAAGCTSRCTRWGRSPSSSAAGAILVGAHKKNVSQLDGIGWRMPFTMAAFFIGSLSIIGLPPLGGSWSKWFMALGAADAGALWATGVYMSELAALDRVPDAHRHAGLLPAGRAPRRGAPPRRGADPHGRSAGSDLDRLPGPVRQRRPRSYDLLLPRWGPDNGTREHAALGRSRLDQPDGLRRCTPSAAASCSSTSSRTSRHLSLPQARPRTTSSTSPGSTPATGSSSACVLLVLAARELRKFVMRAEDYYDA